MAKILNYIEVEMKMKQFNWVTFIPIRYHHQSYSCPKYKIECFEHPRSKACTAVNFLLLPFFKFIRTHQTITFLIFWAILDIPIFLNYFFCIWKYFLLYNLISFGKQLWLPFFLLFIIFFLSKPSFSFFSVFGESINIHIFPLFLRLFLPIFFFVSIIV